MYNLDKITADTILSSLPQAILLVDAELNVIFANQTAEGLFGQSSSQLSGRKLYSLTGRYESWIRLCTQAINKGIAIRLFDIKLELISQTIPVTAHITPIINGQVIITLENQDGAQKLASFAAKNDVSRASGLIAAMLAHEVKNPLSGIRGAAQLIMHDIAEEQKPLANLICRETDRINALLTQMDIFASGSNELRAINIHEILQYVISITKNGFASNVTFIERYDPSLPTVSTNWDLLVQMLLNLIKNAAEAMERTATKKITISTYYQTGFRLSSVPLPIAIDIEDSGAGIAQEVRDNLFSPLFSTKEHGRGLGLAIVAKIAHDLGASVELGEKRDSGAIFTIRLPIAS